MKIYTCEKATKIEYAAIKVEVIGEKIKFTQYTDHKIVNSIEQPDGTFVDTPIPFSIDTAKPEDVTEYVFDLSLAKELSQSDSGCAWNIYMTQSKLGVNPWFVNSHAVTSPIRGNAVDVYHLGKKEVPFAVLSMPRRDASLSECFLGLNIGGIECLVFDNGSAAVMSGVGDGNDLTFVRELAMPKFLLAVGSVSPESVAEVTVTVVTKDGSTDESFNDPIYFESTGGYIAMSKVAANRGVAKTRLRATDLIAGDVVTVKAGTKFFTSLAKMDVAVVA